MNDKRNMYCFGIGTVGRDMLYTTVSMFLMFYFTDVLNLPDNAVLVLTSILMVLRIFDAVNDPIMGIVVENTRTNIGKFKPGIIYGGFAAAALTVVMFLDLGISGAAYYVFFALCYLGWDFAYGLNDVAYWSMLPSLSTDQKVREKTGSFARTCASIGLFTVVAGIVPVTELLGSVLGDMRKAWSLFAVIAAVLMMGFQMITVFGVKENKGYFKPEAKTSLRGMFSAIIKNDQLLYIAASLSLFMTAYTTTTSFGLHFFKYAYGDEGTYSVFALVLGLSQLLAFSVFPSVSARMTRKRVFTMSIILVVVGYLIFFFSPMNILLIGAAAVMIFFGQGFIQILMLVFLADTVEYGQWKTGKRNESVTFSVQPFINKISGAIASGVTGFTLVISGINEAGSAADVPSGGITVMKISMLLLPLVLIAVSYLIYHRKFQLDEKKYAAILSDLKVRGDIELNGGTEHGGEKI